jgi:hypothetical protein
VMPAMRRAMGALPVMAGLRSCRASPIEVAAVVDFSTLLRRDVPDAVLPKIDGPPFFYARYFEYIALVLDRALDCSDTFA